MKHRETSQRLARVVSPECALEAVVGGLVAIAHSVVVISPSGPGDRMWALSLSVCVCVYVCRAWEHHVVHVTSPNRKDPTDPCPTTSLPRQ